MKQFLLLLFTVCTFQFSFAQWDLGFGYTNQSPLGEMAGNINAAHGFHFQTGYRLPVLRKHIVASFETGKGIYGAKKSNPDFSERRCANSN